MTKILIVEDQRIIAKDIEESLLGLGYDVLRVVTTGEEAIKKVEESKPDLVLMDIVLKGNISGIEAAERIRENSDVPVVYLTAHTDEDTLRRAKVTEPFGYILKPFKVEELKSSIEMAIYKHRLEKRIRQRSRRLHSTLNSIGDAVFTTDIDARVTFMNPSAENLTGWKQKEAKGKDLSEVLKVQGTRFSNPLKGRLAKCLKHGVSSDSTNHTIIDRKGVERFISYRVSPLRDNKKDGVGTVLIVRESTNRNLANSKELKVNERESGISKEIIPIIVVVASPSALVQEGMRKTVETEDDIEIVAEASNLLESLKLIGQKTPDLLLIDTALLELDILKIQQTINENSADTKILLLLHDLDEDFIIKSIYLGVQGYIKDSSDPSQIVQAIRSIESEEIWAERGILEKVLKHVLGTRKNNLGLLTAALTSREKEVVDLIAEGHSNKQVSQLLSISKNTVRNHLANIFSKLGISKRLQLRDKFKG